ncbi:hypothetical protein JKP88DRAFT_152243, partial [Tribonema minus]
RCKAGYDGKLNRCYQQCPSGYRDDGITSCLKPSAYGRGGGFPWKFGDTPFRYDKAESRCEKANPSGCERQGLIYYPKCRSGFHSVGLVCSPDCPAGMRDFGIGCSKNIFDRNVGDPD